ncbi:MAG: glycine zipper 2TM domain-containing protein [Burkholderiaceae bacterium]|nr:MAG: glycine zipper 2TM domain-containing protein [Burkholderiaceae bacterium]
MEQVQAKRIHPIILAAAGAVLLFCLIGSAAVLGWLPVGHTEKSVQAPPCLECGVISAITPIKVKGEGTGTGAVVGGLTGALVGNQFGSGNGRTAMTVVGAAGGAYAGNEIEKNAKSHIVYHISVKMEDGTTRTLSQSQSPPFAVGDRVRVVNGALQRHQG